MRLTASSSRDLRSAGTLSQLALLKIIAPIKGATLKELIYSIFPRSWDHSAATKIGTYAGGVDRVGIDLKEEIRGRARDHPRPMLCMSRIPFSLLGSRETRIFARSEG